MPLAETDLAGRALAVYADLRDRAERLAFATPVTHVYNPLAYAWPAIEQYVRRYGATPRRVLLLGMNPGPWGMAQTGVPFGEVGAVRDWLQLDARVGKPAREHPRRPVLGLACPRREVSGERLWGLFAERFRTPSRFFGEHLVLNHCPLVFLEASGRNRTPDKLPAAEREPLLAVCDAALGALIDLYRPAWCIGIGTYAQARLETVCRRDAGRRQVRVGRLLHPSPASPVANRGWAAAATRMLVEQGVWEDAAIGRPATARQAGAAGRRPGSSPGRPAGRTRRGAG
jgi:single-strand selective monofunctional uracil DNA glycosylase